MELILKSLSKSFNQGQPNEVEAVRDVLLTFSGGTNTLIVGHNGSGKSTLLFLIDGRVAPTSGTILFNGSPTDHLPPHRRAPWLFRLFQDSVHGIVPQGTIAENMALAETRHHQRSSWRPLVQTANLDLYAETLAVYRPELRDQLAKKAYTLSPGERQGLVLALLRLQARGAPGVLLADEPTASLDPTMSRKCMETIADYSNAGWICLSVTHDRDWIDRHKGRLIEMANGRIIKDDNRG